MPRLHNALQLCGVPVAFQAMLELVAGKTKTCTACGWCVWYMSVFLMSSLEGTFAVALVVALKWIVVAVTVHSGCRSET